MDLVSRVERQRHWLLTISLVAASVAVALSWLIREFVALCARQALAGVGGCYATLTTADAVVRAAAGVAIVTFAAVLLVDVRSERLQISTITEETGEP
jgi:hypothetical protein